MLYKYLFIRGNRGEEKREREEGDDTGERRKRGERGGEREDESLRSGI